jgi:DNA-binding HxlR family transcriptional regulator
VIFMAHIELCPRYEQAIEILGKRWTGLILRILQDGPKRFSEFTECIPGISAKVLTGRMKELEQQGIVRRDVYPETPVRIEYSLTEKGQAMEPVLDAIQSWASQWID